MYVTSKMEDATVLLDTLVILVQSVHQTVISLDVMITFIVKPATLASTVISVTSPAQYTARETVVTEMVDVHVILGMQAILVPSVHQTVEILDVMTPFIVKRATLAPLGVFVTKHVQNTA